MQRALRFGTLPHTRMRQDGSRNKRYMNPETIFMIIEFFQASRGALA